MIFVVGPSGSGKSYLAKSLVEYGRGIGIGRDLTVLEASSWIRGRTNCWENSPEATRFLTQETLKALKEDPEVITKELKRRMEGNRIDILVGLRTVKEFSALYVPQRDRLIVMLGQPVTAFEKEGVEDIKKAANGSYLLLIKETYAISGVWEAVSSYVSEE